MPQPRAPALRGVDAFLSAARDPGRNLREKYTDDPLGLAERLGLKLPRKPVQVMQELGVYDPEIHGPITPGIRDLVNDVCTGEIESAAGCASRGGGKSLSVAFIEFFLVFLKDFDALNLGGSELQADNVYQYLLGFLETDPYWLTLVKGEPQKEKTFTQESAWIRVLTASQKSVRSPHAGGMRKGKMRGGILVIDEEAETEANIVNASLSTINTAMPSVNIRVSTFHNIEGSYADLIDNHVEMGYKLYSWDIMDVCAGCECGPAGCESEEKCFREDHFETFLDPDDGTEKKRLLHKAYCSGRAKYAEGWVPMTEIVKLWKRMKRNHAQWEIEAMGSRPSSKGHVVKDLGKFASNIVEESGEELYVPGYPLEICIDWGCHDDQTEVLTENGWKFFKDVQPKEKVAQFNKDTRKMSFAVPSRLTVRDYEGDLVHFFGKTVDVMVTPNHRMLARQEWQENWLVKRADEVEGWSKPYVMGSIEWTGREARKFVLPAVPSVRSQKRRGFRSWPGIESREFLMDDWVEFLGYMLSEGGLCRRPNAQGELTPYCVKASQRDVFNTAKMRKCFDNLGIEYSEYFNPKTGDTNWTFLGRQLWKWWEENIGVTGATKRIPRKFLNLSKRQLRILFVAMMDGDGHWQGHNEVSGTYHSTSEQLCRDFQELCTRLGYRSHMKLRFPAEGNRKARWSVGVSLGGDRILPSSERVPYKGKVYCCTVPEEFIITRRNGCITYQGNTNAAGIEVWQEQRGDKHVMVFCEQFEETSDTQLIGEIVSLSHKYRADLATIAADIGGGGAYFNPKLRDEYRLPVRDVNFQTEKEAAAGALNIYNDGGLIVIPAEADTFAHQVRNWKRANGRIVKGNDHLCDTALCYFAKFIDRLGLHTMRVAPRAFNSGAEKKEEKVWVKRTRNSINRPSRPMIRTLGSRVPR